MAFSFDVIGSVYLGQVGILNDETPISGEPNVRELNLAYGDTFTFIGYGYGGASNSLIPGTLMLQMELTLTLKVKLLKDGSSSLAITW